MKKLILVIGATSVVFLSGNAQQLQFADNGANSTDTTINGVPNSTQDLNLELLIGSTSTSVTTDVVTLLLSDTTATATTALGSVQPAQGDITASGGDIVDLTINAYIVPSGTTWAEVLAWTGNYSTYASALYSLNSDTGLSQIFQVVPSPAAGSPATDISNIETVADGNIDLHSAILIPEPSTLAMAGIGLASTLIFRRKKK
jgi:hypothetical protein